MSIQPANPPAAGFSLIELLFVIVFIAVAGGFLISQFGTIDAGSKLQRATIEIESVRGAAQAWRQAPAQQGRYTNVSVRNLRDNGYGVRPLTNGRSQNAYGLDIAIAPHSGGTDATLTYQTDDPEACAKLLQQYRGIPGVKNGGTSCSGSTLSLRLE